MMANAPESSLGEFKKELWRRVVGIAVAGFLAIIVAIGAAAWAVAKSLPSRIGFVPSGAVAAFDLPACPTGWSPHKKVWGRFVIGAVDAASLGEIPGDFRRDDRNEDLAERPFGKAGGEQKHQLSIDEMPSHDHGGSTGGSSAGVFVQYPNITGAIGRLNGDVPFSAADHNHAIGKEGKSLPHNNMPPYIALRYCLKE